MLAVVGFCFLFGPVENVFIIIKNVSAELGNHPTLFLVGLQFYLCFTGMAVAIGGGGGAAFRSPPGDTVPPAFEP